MDQDRTRETPQKNGADMPVENGYGMSLNATNENAAPSNVDRTWAPHEENNLSSQPIMGGSNPSMARQTPVYTYDPPMQQSYTPSYQAPVAPKKKKNGGAKWIWAMIACVLCLAIGLVGGGFAIRYGWIELDDLFDLPEYSGDHSSQKPTVNHGSTDDSKGADKEVSNPPLNLKEEENTEALTASGIYSACVNGVVGVTTKGTTTNIFGQETTKASTGSGFIIDEKNGYILTNAHVVASGDSYRVSLYNGETYDAKLIGIEADNDVAVLQIDAENLQALPLGDSDGLVVGQEIVAIGNPLGELTYTLTRGIVSALNRAINIEGTPITMFQVDAAVNPGNSGGPAINSLGQVVGIVSAKYASETIEGIGFCIPINDALHIANELIEKGYVGGKPALGIATKDYYGRGSVGYYYVYVRVERVDAGSCAEKAGMKVGDIITAVNDVEVVSSDELRSKIKQYKAGETIKLTVYRQNNYIELTVVLDEDTSGAIAS